MPGRVDPAPQTRISPTGEDIFGKRMPGARAPSILLPEISRGVRQRFSFGARGLAPLHGVSEGADFVLDRLSCQTRVFGVPHGAADIVVIRPVPDGRGGGGHAFLIA